MVFEISTVAFMLGMTAGTIFFLDGWRPANRKKDISHSFRYRGLVVLVGGAIISPITDRLLLETQKNEFFLGYLSGASVGWISSLGVLALLYTFWKMTKDREEGHLKSFGQISLSLIEIFESGVHAAPYQREVELQNHIAETKLAASKKLKQDNPKAYLKKEEQKLSELRLDLESKFEANRKLQEATKLAESEPEKEAHKLIGEKEEFIKTIQEEVGRALRREENNRTHKIVSEYQKQIIVQEKEINELKILIADYEKKTITRSDFYRKIAFKRIDQYEKGGVFVGEFILGQTTVKIYRGDITNLNADAIVSSDDNYLSMGGGVSRRILSVGGNAIRSEANRLLPLSIGEVVQTSAGRLNANKIFHAIVIDFDTNEYPSEAVLRKVISNCISMANENKFRSIAIPLFGTGAGGYPAKEAFHILLSQIDLELTKKGSSISEIFIVAFGHIGLTLDIEALSAA